MFFGEYVYKVDEKGRVPLPPKFRQQMKDGVILSKGMEKCTVAYPISQWKKLADSLAAKAVTPSNLRTLNRSVFSSASGVSFDGQGRITLPNSLRTYAGIEDTVVVVGANNYVELWNNELLEKQKASDEEQVSQIMDSFGVQS